MNDAEVSEHRYRFFSEKGISLAVEHDKILVTLFTGIIAAIIALLMSRTVGFWAGICFVIADLTCVVGVSTCLLHMAFSARVMFLSAAMFSGEDAVPNLVAREEPTEIALKKNRAYTQAFYLGQLVCLLWAVFFAALGVVFFTWESIGWTGFLVAVAMTTGLIWSVYKPMILIHAATRRMLERRATSPTATQESDG